MHIKYLLIAMLSLPLSATAKQQTIHSPNHTIQVVVSDSGGLATYAVDYAGLRFVEASPLGLVVQQRDLATQLHLKGISQRQVSDHYRLSTIKQSTVNYQATEAVCRFHTPAGDSLDVVFRVGERDVAYCYRFYPKGDQRMGLVMQSIQFPVPQWHHHILCPQAKPMVACRYSPSYETTTPAMTLWARMGGAKAILSLVCSVG
jgi:hypothetical protein